MAHSFLQSLPFDFGRLVAQLQRVVRELPVPGTTSSHEVSKSNAAFALHAALRRLASVAEQCVASGDL